MVPMTRGGPSRAVPGFACVVTWVAVCVMAATGASAQEVPEVGRPGKDVMWVPSPDPLVRTMLELAGVTAQDTVMDLGSGDGRTVIAAAQRGARAVGVEYDPELVELSRLAALEAGVGDRATFMTADLFDVDLSPATVITMFLLPDLNLKLRPRLLALKPGTRIVSNTWDFDDWVADETVMLDPCPRFCTALLWVVPAGVGGRWRLPDGELALEQHYQMVTGTLETGAARYEIEEGRVHGVEVDFRARGTSYTARVGDGVMEGVAVTAAKTSTWRATRVED